MAKGFKDSKGNFHPTNNGKKSSRDKSIETSGIPNLKGEPEQKNQATIDAELLSDHFGTSNITAKGNRKYVIQFGEQEYDNKLDNKVLDSFIDEYPNGRMDIIPKDKIINIKFLDSEEQILAEELKQKIMGLGEERVESMTNGAGEGSTPEQDVANTRAIWEREKKTVIELADLEFRTLREGFAES